MTNRQPTSDGLDKLSKLLDLHFTPEQLVYIEEHYVARGEKTVLCAYGRSETRLVHYVNEFDGSYCYTELLEGESDLHTLRVAQVYDADFDAWNPLEANQ